MSSSPGFLCFGLQAILLQINVQGFTQPRKTECFQANIFVKSEGSLEITHSLTPLYRRLVDLPTKVYKIRTRFWMPQLTIKTTMPQQYPQRRAQKSMNFQSLRIEPCTLCRLSQPQNTTHLPNKADSRLNFFSFQNFMSEI